MSLAENTYQVVLRLDPDNASSRKGLKRIKLMNSSKNAGNEAFKAGKWREAEQHYTQALELDSHLKSSFVAQCACNRLAPHLLPLHALLAYTVNAFTRFHLYHERLAGMLVNYNYCYCCLYRVLLKSAPTSLAHHHAGLA